MDLERPRPAAVLAVHRPTIVLWLALHAAVVAVLVALALDESRGLWWHTVGWTAAYGLGVAALQAAFLHPAGGRPRPLWAVPATTALFLAGLAVPFVDFAVNVGTVVGMLFVEGSVDPSMRPAMGLAYLAFVAAVPGLVVGASQWIALRDRRRGSSWLVLAHAVGVVAVNVRIGAELLQPLGGALGIAVDPPTVDRWLDAVIAGSMSMRLAFGAASGMVVAIVTGAAVLRVRPRHVEMVARRIVAPADLSSPADLPSPMIAAAAAGPSGS